MKKSINMNLSGQIFHIDEDAYKLLEAYLEELQGHFSRSEGDPEIITEFEERIAEHLVKLSPSGSRLVDIALISRVIELMGRPEEIFDLEQEAEQSTAEEVQAASHLEPEPQITTEETQPQHKLYRNLQGAWLCGVFNGLADYLGWSVGAMRIVYLLLWIPFIEHLILVPPLAYLIAWMVIPVGTRASTESQRVWGAMRRRINRSGQAQTTK